MFQFLAKVRKFLYFTMPRLPLEPTQSPI